MGTRSLTVFMDDETELCVMYRQFDGYPDGHGKELAEFLTGITMVNGINETKGERLANGMGCLAAQVIGHFKDGKVGGFYIYPANSRDCGEEYIYFVEGEEGKEPKITVQDYDKKELFKGFASEYADWLEARNNNLSDE